MSRMSYTLPLRDGFENHDRKTGICIIVMAFIQTVLAHTLHTRGVNGLAGFVLSDYGFWA